MNQPSPIESETARSMLDQLLDDSRLYHKGADYQNLLDFVVRLRNFAPFNALLLQIQKPGLHHAASARDWRETFGRTIKDGARPLLILWPFGPVALVYDLMDTEGPDLPVGVAAFAATGVIDHIALEHFAHLIAKKSITWNKVDAGDLKAGSIERLTVAQSLSSADISASADLQNALDELGKLFGSKQKPSAKAGEASSYRMNVNKNHAPNVQFATLAHELAHLYLGHLGRDSYLGIPDRPPQTHQQQELEAESTAYIVCARNGVDNKSDSYLATYVKQDTTMEQLDMYQIMRAAGQVETLLGLAAHTKVDRPKIAPATATATAMVPAAKADGMVDKQRAAKAKMFNAAAKIATLMGTNTGIKWTQEQEVLPVVEMGSDTKPLIPGGTPELNDLGKTSYP